MANYRHQVSPHHQEQFMFVNPFENPQSVKANPGRLRQSLRWLGERGALAIFAANLSAG